ncbi:site-2 protease family protein [Streptomyces sp. H10-C2]|uniref:site-2 protease family protein n=1 Tax=unclassified Streptomyces TaxID=2593676 RepID=UPI0024BA47FA|nr:MULTISPECIES: site-2 protease family protein [unclassified Streptomyces]MDJ0346400.1 site-2 protease family protein [Streptomyces sp. PH10-H1]MDJ0374163.1 site-2 protease family protein [Streptomyces sp. H10-C2]
MSSTDTRRDHRISPIFLGIAAVMAVSGWAVWSGFSSSPGFAVFLFVVSGWVVSLCLHEYAHARTALHSGDISIGAKGYLTLNPLKYTHALLSIVLPVLFVIMGGIGLPGGAVFIERGRIQGRWKHSVISAAGPLTNILFAIVLMLPFALGAVGSWPDNFLVAFAFLAMLQVTAAILNLLPVPGLDGYGIIEPWLSYDVRRQVEPFAQFGLLAVFGCLWIPEVNRVFFDFVYTVMGWFDVPEGAISYGYTLFRFWSGSGA